MAAREAGGQGHGQGTSPTHTCPATGHLHRVTAATGLGYLLIAIATAAAGAAGKREACWAGRRAEGHLVTGREHRFLAPCTPLGARKVVKPRCPEISPVPPCCSRSLGAHTGPEPPLAVSRGEQKRTEDGMASLPTDEAPAAPARRGQATLTVGETQAQRSLVPTLQTKLSRGCTPTPQRSA